MAKRFLKFFVALHILGLSVRLQAMDVSVSDGAAPDFDHILAKMKFMVKCMQYDGVMGPFFSSHVALPTELLSGSPRGGILLSRLQYAASLLYYQNELLALVSRIDVACAKRDALQPCIEGACLIGDEKKIYDDVVQMVNTFGSRYNLVYGFLLAYLARPGTASQSVILHNMVSLKMHESEIKMCNIKIARIEDFVCDHYDAKQWKALRGCIYPLLHLLETDAWEKSVFDLRQSEWYSHAQKLFQQLTGLIDLAVGQDSSLQRYRANLWNPRITIVPKTALSVDIDTLVNEIEQVGSCEQSARMASSSPSPKKKYKKRKKREAAALFILTAPEELADDARAAWVDEEDFDPGSAFWQSAAGSPSDLDGTPDFSGRFSRLSINTASDASPASSPDSGGAKARVFAHYDYDERILIWHGADDAMLHEYVVSGFPGAFYINVVAQHRVPFVIENQFVELGRTEARILNGKAYRTILFDGALVFGSGRRCRGTYEISRPVSKLDLVVHRFFKVDYARAWPDSLVLPERGQCERCMMCNDHEYTVYENDQAVCIIENDSWLKVTHVIFK